MKRELAEQKFEICQYNYKTVNEELIKDMTALYEDRLVFFDYVMATVRYIYLLITLITSRILQYATQLHEYYKAAAILCANISQLVVTVNRNAVHAHPPVITPSESSASKVSVTTPKKTSSSSSLDAESRYYNTMIYCILFIHLFLAPLVLLHLQSHCLHQNNLYKQELCMTLLLLRYFLHHIVQNCSKCIDILFIEGRGIDF
jgi:hypothetical protein